MPLQPTNTPQDAYDQFDAVSLFCPKCKQAMPVRKRLLLILPTGNKYEYLCARCSTSLGTKLDSDNKDFKIVL